MTLNSNRSDSFTFSAAKLKLVLFYRNLFRFLKRLRKKLPRSAGLFFTKELTVTIQFFVTAAVYVGEVVIKIDKRGRFLSPLQVVRESNRLGAISFRAISFRAKRILN